ncbi:unnamed protein product [Arctia plantaginis]|uniref:CYTH domain-containing protein n=1 Tax=Arctia plantaginis TaxID=874455 RepID=A0A8S1BXX4_ARCPL|nr:unnamed protein product [Arctia plantaginis]
MYIEILGFNIDDKTMMFMNDKSMFEENLYFACILTNSLSAEPLAWQFGICTNTNFPPKLQNYEIFYYIDAVLFCYRGYLFVRFIKFYPYCNMSLRNVEIKAKITDYDNICKVAEELSGKSATLIKQDDTFYNVNEGRLKLRTFEEASATLVRYDRVDEGGPKLSNYELLQFDSEQAKLLDTMLKKCLGIRGRVVKERKLYMVDQTRIHIDTVHDLGHFMELEVVLRTEQTLEEGQKIAKDLQTKLGVKDEDLIECAYVDLLDKKNN